MSLPDRAAAIRLGAARLCLAHAWMPLHEMPLPNGRRMDILALRADGELVCIEVKSGPRDFLVDQKWPEYRDYADHFYFAVDTDFPRSLLPDDVGVIVVADIAAIIRAAPPHRLASARRRMITHRFASLAALRLTALQDPAGAKTLETALLRE